MIPRKLKVRAPTKFETKGGITSVAESKIFEVLPVTIIRFPAEHKTRMGNGNRYHYEMVFEGLPGMLNFLDLNAAGKECREGIDRKLNSEFKPPKSGWENNRYECWQGQRIPEHFEIRPSKPKVSDFYSWKLHLWLKKYPEKNRIFRVDNGEYKFLMIGYDDEQLFILGNKLRGVASHGPLSKSFAYPRAHFKSVEDITDAFWADYYKRGVCAIHTDIVHDWDYVTEQERVCNYCGHKEQSEDVLVTETRWKAA